MMITPLQKKIYDYISSFISENDQSPSLVEIAQGIGISPKSISLISRSIHSLVSAGRLKLDKKGYRKIQIAEPEHTGLPLLGRIAAGVPIEAIEDKRDINFSALLGDGAHFALEVRGDSMIDAAILDGDLVICRHASTGKEGDIVVALIDNLEATLKRISYQVPGRITLVPANPTLKPKAYLPQRIQIQGVFVGLLRLQG